jgi:hypothetical protein
MWARGDSDHEVEPPAVVAGPTSIHVHDEQGSSLKQWPIALEQRGIDRGEPSQPCDSRQLLDRGGST